MNWVSVKDRLPDLYYDFEGIKYSNYVFVTTGKDIFTARYRRLWVSDDKPSWVSELKLEMDNEPYYFTYDDITHWMPIPDLNQDTLMKAIKS